MLLEYYKVTFLLKLDILEKKVIFLIVFIAGGLMPGAQSIQPIFLHTMTMVYTHVFNRSPVDGL